MSFRSLLIAVPLSLAWLHVHTAALHSAEIGLAFWNVENLFDTVDDPKVEGDEEFTPDQPKEWTTTRLELKLRNLVRVINDMNSGKGPTVLGLCEIENRKVLDLLVDRLAKDGRKYGIVHEDSPSYRGIDCALLFDRSKVSLVNSRVLRIQKFRTRDVLEAQLKIDGNTLFVFTNHWPSRRNPEQDRIAVAKVLRNRIDDILKTDSHADIAIIGDLNDTPINRSVGSTLRTWGDPEQLRPGVFFNSIWPVHKSGLGTYVYKNKWDVLDHIILSPGMLDTQGLSWVKDSTQTVSNDYQMFVPDNPSLLARPSRSYLGPRFFGEGYSDHLPVECRLQVHTR